MRRFSILVVAALTLLAPGTIAAVEFTHGVASGDVTPISAVLWTRTDAAADLSVELKRISPGFGPERLTRHVSSTAASDFTARVLVAPLLPDATYRYQFKGEGAASEVGSFRTAPLPWVARSLRFAFTGDSDGTKVGGVPFHGGFEVLDAVRNDVPEFFVYHGDTIYSDSGLRATGPATTLQEYRDTYKVNRESAALRNLLAATSSYVTWDDHEVQNDYDGQTVDPARYAAGRRAFHEFLPTFDLPLPIDSSCAGAPRFRVLPWGSEVDLIFLDERSCRSADAAFACLGDLAPTLPAPFRVGFGLSPAPPAGCLETLNDPSRTVLGPVQKALFKAVLLHSKAKVKLVFGGYPIQQYWALPYDRWEGYVAERNEILGFIRDNAIANVVFLATDNHANYTNEVVIDTFAAPQPIAREFVTGPIATFTLQQEILAFGGPAALAGFNALFDIAGVDCRNLHKFSYALVEVDATAGTVEISFKDADGAPVLDAITSAPCGGTVGP